MIVVDYRIEWHDIYVERLWSARCKEADEIIQRSIDAHANFPMIGFVSMPVKCVSIEISFDD